MAIEAKATLLNTLEQRFGKVLTACDRDQAISIISDVLAAYDVRQTDPAATETDDLLEAYISAMEVQGRSPKTIERYRYLIGRMTAAVKVPTRSITVYHLRRYIADEKARGLSDRTLEGFRQCYSAYFNWLQRENLIETNPTANLGAIKCVKKLKAIYTDVDMERLKRVCPTKRDLAIISFLASTGCRISEMTQLNRDDVDLVNLECTVLGKGNKERTVFLDPVAGMAISEYLAQRKDDSPALFAGKGTPRIHPGGVRAMLVRIAGVAEVDHVHPHKFRRTLATNLIRHGMPIQEVASILGHDKLDTTMEYVVLDKSGVKNAYRRYV